MILLSRKQTDRRYIEDDIALIQAAARRAGAVLERMRLVQSVAEEAMARRRLAELNRLKNDFLSRMAHDLRTPLASIGWSTENLLDGIAGSVTASQTEYLQSIKTATGHLNRLVGNLLDISRMERGTLTLEFERVALPEVLQQVIDTLKPLAAERGVQLDLRVADGSVAVRGNNDKLFEVAMNLIDNAIKYAPDQTVVEVTVASAAGGRQAFAVRDHGQGLGDVDVARLYEQFSQGTPSPHSHKHGFGLGLYIVKTYMDLMAGDVSARNHPGGGANFTCTLPAYDQAAAN
jgi:signal transduction histidine kinase